MTAPTSWFARQGHACEIQVQRSFRESWAPAAALVDGLQMSLTIAVVFEGSDDLHVSEEVCPAHCAAVRVAAGPAMMKMVAGAELAAGEGSDTANLDG